MKLTTYSQHLLTLTFAFCSLAAGAQVRQQSKTAAKNKRTTTHRPAAKLVSKPAARKIGEAAVKVPVDTIRKGSLPAPVNSNTSLSEEIVVTTTYKPVLADAVKIRRNPNLEDVSPYKAPLTYTTLDKKLSKDSEIKPLVALPLANERDTVTSNNYVKLGLGSLKTTYAEGYFNNGQDQALQYGAYVKHFAQQGSLNKQNESRNDVGVFGKSIGTGNTVSGKLTYNYRSNYLYGYDANNPPLTAFNPAHQKFNTVGAEGELAKNYQDSTDRAFTYALKLKGYLFSDAFKARENNLVVSGFLNQTIKQFYAGLSGSIDVASQTDSLYSQNNSLLRLNPYLKFQGENYKIDAGVNLVNQFGYATKFYVFPSARLELQVVPNYVRLFAEAKGDVNRTSLQGLSLINPFLGKNLNIQNSVDQLDLTIGVKGTIIAGLGFKASVFRNSVKNLPLLVSNFSQTPFNNSYRVIYDGGRARITGFTGELDYKASDGFDLFGRVEFKDYSLASEAQPWNLPKFLLTAGTAIHISNKVDINGSLLIRGSVQDPYPYVGAVAGTVYRGTSINSFADLSAGVQYKVNKQFNLFLQANNILNTDYQTWLYYPNYGFNIFGGVGYRF